MRVSKTTFIEVYFQEHERLRSNGYIKHMQMLGWSVEVADGDAGGDELCTQLMQTTSHIFAGSIQPVERKK